MERAARLAVTISTIMDARDVGPSRGAGVGSRVQRRGWLRHVGVARFVGHLSGSVSPEGDSGTPDSLAGEFWRGP